MKNPQHQSGIALVIAILVVALTATITIFMRNQHELDKRRTGNLLSRDQAYLYNIGAEAWAMGVLNKDIEDGSKFDHLKEDWATQGVLVDVEGGKVSGQIIDLQGRFNINNLVDGKKTDGLAYERFRELLRQLEIDVSMAEPLLDWLDSNQDSTGVNGAEDYYYMGLEKPYRAANSLMKHPSELRMVKGFDTIEPKILDALEKELTTLPTRTPININTASETLLKAIGFPDSMVANITSTRENEPYEDMKAIQALPDFKQANIDIKDLGVASSYFLVISQTRIDRGENKLFSVLHRDNNGTMYIISRSQGVQ